MLELFNPRRQELYIHFFGNSSKFRFKHKIWIDFISVVPVMTVLTQCNLITVILSQLNFLVPGNTNLSHWIPFDVSVHSSFLKLSCATFYSPFMPLFIIPLPLRHTTVTGEYSKLLAFWWWENWFPCYDLLQEPLNSMILSQSHILSFPLIYDLTI